MTSRSGRRFAIRSSFFLFALNRSAIDAMQSVGGWRSSLAQWTTVQFTESTKALHFDPLLVDAVPNSLDVGGGQSHYKYRDAQ